MCKETISSLVLLIGNVQGGSKLRVVKTQLSVIQLHISMKGINMNFSIKSIEGNKEYFGELKL